MSLKALIIDDEQLARENLKMLLTDFCPEVEILGSASNKDEGISKIEELKPNVVFLDIRMPSGSEGFELLEHFEEQDFMVVFVTAFKDYAIKAFNANAVHYLLKPIDIEELQTAVEKLNKIHGVFEQNPENKLAYKASINNLKSSIEKGKSGVDRITINHSKGFKVVEVKDIVHLEANGNCTVIKFSDGSKYLDTRTLKIYEQILADNDFYRVHKSHLINLDYMLEYMNQDGHYVVMKNGAELPIARNRLKEFLQMSKQLA